MSSNERPGMAMNEDEIERHVEETREQAKRANYPARSTPLHAPARQVEDPRSVAPAKTRRSARKVR